MRQFINANEDVLICPDGFTPNYEWVPLEGLTSGFFAKCINSIGLFQTCKAIAEADYESESTVALCIIRKLSEFGFSVNSNKEDIPLRYRNYDTLTLATLYGGNSEGFEVSKVFKLRKAYIIAEYNPTAIEQKISYLKEYGFIKLGE